jgi:hypothetical protein
VCGEKTDRYHTSVAEHCPRCNAYIRSHEAKHGIEDCIESQDERLRRIEEHLFGVPGEPIYTVNCGGCGRVNKVPKRNLIPIPVDILGSSDHVAPCPWCPARTAVKA